MTGLQSLWTQATGFKLDRATTMLFSASVAFLHKFFLDTELVTDQRGIEIADRLRWPFTSYSLGLENFCPQQAKHVWMLGKLEASKVQTRPHVHIDLDLVLYKPLPSRVLTSRVAVQGKDTQQPYRTGYISQIMQSCGLPESAVPFNTAILLWNDLQLRDGYVRYARSLALAAASAWPSDVPANGTGVTIVAEQAGLSEFLRLNRVKAEECAPMPENIEEDDFEDIAFVHLWSVSKQRSKWLNSIERKFRTEAPEAYENFRNGYNKLLERGIATH